MANSPANEINAVIQQIQNIQVTMDLAVYTGNVIQDLTWIQKKAEQTKATVPVDADTSAAQKALEKIRSQIQERFGLGGLVSKVTSQLTASNGMEKILQTGAAYQQSLEKSQAAWNTLLGSQEKAADQMQYLQGMAESAPFSLEALDSGAQKLAQMGYQGRQLRQILRGAGEAAAAVGGGDASMTAIIDALAQIGREGRASQDALDAIAGQGVLVWEMLAQQMGRSVTEIRTMSQEGQLLADTVIPSLAEGMQTQFGGAMQAQSQTMQGMTTSLQNLFEQFSGIATEGAFDVLKESLGGFLEKLREGEEVEKFAQTIGGAIAGATKILLGFVEAAWSCRGAIVTIIGAVTIGKTISSIASAVRTVIGAFDGLKTAVTATIAVLKGMQFLNLGGFMAIAGAIGAIVASMANASQQTETETQKLYNQLNSVEESTEEIREENEKTFQDMQDRLGRAQASYKTLQRLIESGASDASIDLTLDSLLEDIPEAASLIREMGDGFQIDTQGMEELFDYKQRELNYQAILADAQMYGSEASSYLNQSTEAMRQKNNALEDMRELLRAHNAGTVSFDETTEEFVFSDPIARDKNLQNDEEAQRLMNQYSDAYREFWDLEKKANEAYSEAKANQEAAMAEVEESALLLGEKPDALQEEEERPEITRYTPDFVDQAMEPVIQYGGYLDALEVARQYLRLGNTPVEQGGLNPEAAVQAIQTVVGDKLSAFTDVLVNEWENLAEAEAGLAGIEEAIGSRYIEEQLTNLLEMRKNSDLTPEEQERIDREIERLIQAQNGDLEMIADLVGMLYNKDSNLNVQVYVYGNHQAYAKAWVDPEVAQTDTTTGYRPAWSYAEGTSYYPGGVTRIHERGDELIELPTGSKIYPAQRSRGYQRVENPGSPVTVNIYGMTVREEADIDRVARALYQKLRLAALNA